MLRPTLLHKGGGALDSFQITDTWPLGLVVMTALARDQGLPFFTLEVLSIPGRQAGARGSP